MILTRFLFICGKHVSFWLDKLGEEFTSLWLGKTEKVASYLLLRPPPLLYDFEIFAQNNHLEYFEKSYKCFVKCTPREFVNVLDV